MGSGEQPRHRARCRRLTAVLAGACAWLAVGVIPAAGQAAPPGPVPAEVEVVCPAGARIGFPDVAGGAHAEAVGCTGLRRVVGGFSDGRFGPAGPVRRDQLASVVARALEQVGVPMPGDPPDAFPDDDGVHEPAINALAAQGVVGGDTGGRYRPADPATRRQVALVLARAYEAAAGTATGVERFIDPDDRPGALLRRDQLATVAVRLMAALIADGAGTVPRSPEDRALADTFPTTCGRVVSPAGAAVERCFLTAATAGPRSQGLMGVTDPGLAGHEGMLFRFDTDVTSGFFMRNTPLPLSIAWLDAGGYLVDTADMVPCGDRVDCPIYRPDEPYRWAVEVPQGRLAEVGLVPGARLEL